VPVVYSERATFYGIDQIQTGIADRGAGAIIESRRTTTIDPQCQRIGKCPGQLFRTRAELRLIAVVDQVNHYRVAGQTLQ